MPKIVYQYYRCRRAYTPRTHESDIFQRILADDEMYMCKKAPPDCDVSALRRNRITERMKNGNIVYYYFESEAEMKKYLKSVHAP